MKISQLREIVKITGWNPWEPLELPAQKYQLVLTPSDLQSEDSIYSYQWVPLMCEDDIVEENLSLEQKELNRATIRTILSAVDDETGCSLASLLHYTKENLLSCQETGRPLLQEKFLLVMAEVELSYSLPSGFYPAINPLSKMVPQLLSKETV